MIRSFLTVSSGTLASRLLGFLRDSMLAALLGTGAVADAFLVAFQLVNVARRLLSEGALNAALVPMWLRLREAEGAAAAAAFAGRVLGTISVALVAGSVLIGALMPLVITLLAPGFAGEETRQLAVTYARLMLPYLAFAGPATVLLALASAQGRFFLTAFSPLLFNIAMIAAMIVLMSVHREGSFVALMLAATVGLAGLLQLLILALRRGERVTSPLRASVDAQMRSFFTKAIPGMVASSAPQLLIVAGAIIASSSPSAVSWLYFANRLIELPVGIVGVAMGTVLIPEVTRALHGDDKTAIAHAQSRALELAVGLALPAMLGLIALSTPIVRLLFEHGAFTPADARSTSSALVWLALGLPAHVLAKALSPAFFAREDPYIPLVATLKAFVVAIVLALLLGHFFGANGIAAGLACGAWSNAFSLIRRGGASSGFLLDAPARRRLPRIAAAALLMGALLWVASGLVSGTHVVAQAALLLATIAAAIAAYGLALIALDVTSWREVVNAMRQSPPRDLRA
jgi:putative peptidoglycan lipid II flippase